MLRSALILVGITACYDPSLTDCEVVCAVDTDCAPEHTCSNGLCTGGGAPCEAAPTPPDVAGRYAMTLVNRENGCQFSSWTEGMGTTVDVVVTRNASVVTAEPQGLTASFLDAWLGAHTWVGEQVQDRVSLALAGVKKNKQEKCEYTFDAAFAATLDGDVLRGTVTYVARTNGHVDCKQLTGCTSNADMTAVRAPQ